MKSIFILILAILLFSVTYGKESRDREKLKDKTSSATATNSTSATTTNTTSTTLLSSAATTTSTSTNSTEVEPPHPTIETKIASLSTDEQTYVTCIADFLVSSLTFDSTAAQASALAYMRYYQKNTTLTPTDTSTCGTTVPAHIKTGVSP